MTRADADSAFFENEISAIEGLIDAGRTALHDGREPDLSEMADRVTVLCQNLRDAAGTLADADHVRRRLEDVVGGLDRLEREIAALSKAGGNQGDR